MSLDEPPNLVDHERLTDRDRLISDANVLASLMPEDEFVHRHASIPFNGRSAGGKPPAVERDRLVVPVEVVRARAQPLLGVLRPVVIAAGDLNVLVCHAATVLPAPRGGGRQRPPLTFR